MIVVIDGPAGSGKSSTAMAVANRLGIQYLDSGAIYRTLSLIYIRCERDIEAFFNTLKDTEIDFEYRDQQFRTYLDDAEVTDRIRSPKVSGVVSEVATNAEIRNFVNELMREAVKHDAFIADGRDLGTVVFPDADLKFFMVADVETRASRRYKELIEKGEEASLNEIRSNIEARDQQDSRRSVAPLKKADDAIEIDTTNLSFDEQVDRICDQVKELL